MQLLLLQQQVFELLLSGAVFAFHQIGAQLQHHLAHAHLITVAHINPRHNAAFKVLHHIHFTFGNHLTGGIHHLGDGGERRPREEDQGRCSEHVKAES